MVLKKMWTNWTSYTWLVGVQCGTITLENKVTVF